jgi:predicted transcriptional regulator
MFQRTAASSLSGVKQAKKNALLNLSQPACSVYLKLCSVTFQKTESSMHIQGRNKKNILFGSAAFK